MFRRRSSRQIALKIKVQLGVKYSGQRCFRFNDFLLSFVFFQAKIEELEEELEAERNARSKVCCGFIFLTPSMSCSSSNTS